MFSAELWTPPPYCNSLLLSLLSCYLKLLNFCLSSADLVSHSVFCLSVCLLHFSRSCTSLNSFKFFPILSSSSKSSEVLSSPSRSFQVLSSPFNSFQVLSSPSESFQVPPSTFKSYQVLSISFKSFHALPSPSKSF